MSVPGWCVGTPVFHVERNQWALYAFDTTEKAHIGKRSREWTAVHPTQIGVVREMARCLREIGAGRAPKLAVAVIPATLHSLEDWVSRRLERGRCGPDGSTVSH